MSYKGIMSVAFAAALAGCGGQKPLYSWGDYPSALLSYSKNPDQRDKFAEKLEEVIRKSEAKKNVPPGIYAEYGYVLLEKGNTVDAIAYFGKERDHWPESSAFMTKIITKLSTRASEQAPSSSTGASAASPQ